MVDKAVAVRFEANTTGYESGVKRMESATAKFAKGAESSAQKASKGWGGLAQSVRENEREWTRAGTALTAFGAVTAAGLGVAGKAAIDWESAWTGVLKTVDGSDAQLAGLNQGLRDMALELPATHTEIAAVAEAAGQLGIQTENVESFSRTMLDLGETTNLSANEAATALARFANIMGTSQDEFSNIGAAVVDLGNNFATTEREIVDMGLRLAGAGRQAGLSEGEVLGLATALSSVGIEAEAGGTAFSRVLIEMGVAVDTQGEKLATFAEVAGMSAAEFSRAWEQDAGSAISAFVGGLGEMDAAGQSIQPILEELGMTDIRVGDALRRSASAADIFTGAMQQGNDAYTANVALTEEAALRYETVAAQLAIARNAATEAAISFGEVLMPAIAGGAEAFADLAKWVADLPGPVRDAAVGIGAVTSATSLLLGGTLLAVPKLVEMYDTFRKIQQTAPLAAGAMRGVAAAAGVMAAAIIADEISDAIGDWVSRNDDLEQLETRIRGVGSAAEFAETQVAWMTRSGWLGTEEVIAGSEALDRFAESAQIAFGDNLFDRLGRLQNSGAVERFTEDAKGLDAALAEMVRSGNVEQAEELFGEFWSRVEDRSGVTREEVMQGFVRYEEALGTVTQATLDLASATDAATFPDLAPTMTDNERAMRAASDAAGEYEGQVDQVAEAAAAAKAEQDALTDALLGMVDAAFGAHQGAIDYEAALDNLTASIKENGETHDITTEAGRANQSVLLALAQQSRETAQANLENGDSLRDVSQDMYAMRDAFIEGAMQMGYSRQQAEDLADELGLTSGAVRTLSDDIEAVPSKTVEVAVRTADGEAAVSRIKSKIAGVTGKTVTVTIVESLQRAHMPASYRRSVGLRHGGPVARADGGPVYGPGGPTDDLVPAYNWQTGTAYRLSNDEHILTAREVEAAGGHSEVYRLRKALLAGAVRYDVGGQVPAPRWDRFSSMSYAPSPAPQVNVAAPDLDGLVGRLAAVLESRPIQTQVQVGSRTVFTAANEGRRSYGAPARWADAPRLTGVGG